MSKSKNKNTGVTKKKDTSTKKKGIDPKILNLGFYILITIIFIGVYKYSFDEKVSMNGDNASYYLLGKSLSMGEGYNLYNDIYGKPHNHFPPGYPILIAFVMLFTKNFIVIKLLNGLFMLGTLLLSFNLFLKFKVRWSVALVSVILMMFNYNLMKSSVTMMSEIPFLFFSILSVFLLTRIDFSKPLTSLIKDKNFILFTLCLSFTFHIRTVGVALLAGVLFYLLMERRWKVALASFGSFVLLALPWILRGKMLGLPSSYQGALLKINSYQPELGNMGFSDLFIRIGKNLERYITKEIPTGIFPFLEVNYKEEVLLSHYLPGIALILIALLGIYKLPKYRLLVFGYIGGTFCILMVWPDVWRGVRFLLPLIPFLIFLIIYALSWILEKALELINIKSRFVQFLPLFFLFSILGYTRDYRFNKDTNWQNYPMTRLKLESKMKYEAKWANYYKIAEYVKENLNSSDIIVCRKPQLFHIYSDAFTSMYPYEIDDKKMIQSFKDKNVKYVVIEQLGFSSTGRYLAPAVNKNPQHFRQILHLKDPDTYLLQFIPGN